MQRLFGVIAVLLGSLLLCGCATRNGDDLSRLLRDVDELEAVLASAGAEEGASAAVKKKKPLPAAKAVEVAPPSATVVRLKKPPAASAAKAPAASVTSPPVIARDPVPARGMGSSVAGSDEPEAPDAPVAGIPVPSATGGGELSGVLTIQPDCLVQVSVEEDASLDGSYSVNAIGAIALGYVGPVILYNKTEEEAAAKISGVLKTRHFKNANVKVRILRASYDRVQIVGAVNNPGIVKIGAGDAVPLIDLLLRAGGVRPSVKAARVSVIRSGLLSPLAATLPGDEYSLVSKEGKPAIPDIYIRNNDLVRVYEGAAGKMGSAGGTTGTREILVLGEVKRPGIYKFSVLEPCTIMHLIFKMGGLPPYANTKTIRVMRVDGEGFETEHRVDAREVLKDGDPSEDFELQDGDRVVVPARRISIF